MEGTYHSNEFISCPLINITSTGRKKPIFLSPLLSFYNILHFYFMQWSQLPFCLQSDSLPCSKSHRMWNCGSFKRQERWIQRGEVGSREEGQLCHCFCKMYVKGCIWQSEKELWGNLCWEMRSRRGNKGTGALLGYYSQGRSNGQCRSLVQIDSGSTTDSYCWGSPWSGDMCSVGLYRESLSWRLTDFIWELNN